MNLHQLNFDGAILARGFWLYIWEIDSKDGRTLHYIGKTGDKSSGKSQSPFDRLSKHLGHNKNNNALRRHLGDRKINPEECSFRFSAYGPLFDTRPTREHGDLCDIASSFEKALADAMAEAGYAVINDVKCRKRVDLELFVSIREAFAERFPQLKKKKEK
jgi:hypothetical protein